MKKSSLSVKGCTLAAFEQGGIFIMQHLLGHRVKVFAVSFKGLPLFRHLLQKVKGTDDLF